MQGTEELRLFSEIGVGLVGLIAIFLVLLGRDNRFSPAESFHMRSLLGLAASVVSFALLPLILQLYIDDEQAVWRTASGITLGLALPVGAGMALLQRSLPSGERWGLGFTITLVLWALVTLGMALCVANVAGLAGGPSAAHHIAALGVMVIAALTNFLTVAFRKLL